MEERQSKNSQFASLPGLACLFIFAVTANYFHAWGISAFLLLFFLLCLSSYVWSRGVCKRVEVTVIPEQGRCHAGESGFLTLKVRNRSFFPLVWLDVIIPAGTKPLLRKKDSKDFFWFSFDESGKRLTGLRERLVWMMWQQEITWQEEYLAERRGTAEIRGIHLQAGDGFGLSAREEWYPLPVPFRIVVYPRLIPVRVERLLRITQEAAAKNYGQTEDITLLKSSRPYQPGDAMKKINWRLLASSGQMITNIYETVQPGCVAFLLDLESFKQIRRTENSNGGAVEEKYLRRGSMECMFSVIASCIEEIAKRRIQTALLIPAYGKQEAVFCVPHEGTDTRTECLEALAMADYEAQDTTFSFEEFQHISYKIGTLYICRRTSGKTELEKAAEYMGNSRVSFLCLKKTDEAYGEYSCLYGEDIGVRWEEKEETYERIS